MDKLTTFLGYEIWIFLWVLAALVTYRMLTGKINTHGLLSDKAGGANDKSSPGNHSPARLQLLVITIGGALYYLLLVFTSTKRGEFPDVPNELLLGLGASHSFYLGTKLVSLLRQLLDQSSLGNKK